MSLSPSAPTIRACLAPLAAVVLLLGCSDNPEPTGADGGADAGHDLNTLKVQGTVSIGIASPATGVTVIARCGNKKVTTKSNDKGAYSFTADVKGCSPLVVEFNKESYLPNIRVVHLPPPTSPITMDVPLSALLKLQCGSATCKVENNSQWNLPNKPMKQGWVVSHTGTTGLAYVPGELRQTDGKLTSMLGISFFDFRDKNGNKISKFQSSEIIDICVPIELSSLDWLGDVTPATDTMDLTWYDLEPTKGQWKARSKLAKVSYTKGYKYVMKNGFCNQTLDSEGLPIRNIVSATRSQMADVRSDQLYYKDECFGGNNTKVTEFWVCGQVDGSGWFAWGLGMQQRACFALTVTDQCKAPLSNVVFSIKGRDHGYRAEAWTNSSGKACLDVIPSEPTGKDYDFDQLGGETYMVDVELSWEKLLQNTTKSHQNPKYSSASSAGCAKPSSCTPLIKEMSDWNKGSCN